MVFAPPGQFWRSAASLHNKLENVESAFGRELHMEHLTASEFVSRVSRGRDTKMNTSIYDGLTFECACGQSHSFDSNLTPPEIELGWMRLVIKCPDSNHLTCVKIRGFLRWRMESLFGALIPDTGDTAAVGNSLPAIAGRGIPPESGFVPEYDDEVRNVHSGLPHRIATGPFSGSSSRLYWVIVIFGLSQASPGAPIAVTPKLSFIRLDRSAAEAVHRQLVGVLSADDPSAWTDRFPDLHPESGSSDEMRGMLLELGAHLRG